MVSRSLLHSVVVGLAFRATRVGLTFATLGSICTVGLALLVAGGLTEAATLREQRSYLLGLENARTVVCALCLHKQLQGVGNGHDVRVRQSTRPIFVILL